MDDETNEVLCKLCITRISETVVFDEHGVCIVCRQAAFLSKY